MKRLLAVFLCFCLPVFGLYNANTQWDVRTTGSDANGGGFAPGLDAKDVNGATDLATDSSNAKKVTSATHNFVSGDVNKYIQVTAGTAWVQAYYQIISVASNAAILDKSPAKISSTGGTYSLYSAIDFSQQNSPQVSFTDLLIATPNTTATSLAHTFDATYPGNVINVTAGAGCTVARAQVISVAAGIATFDRALGTIGSTCTAAMGGSLITPNRAGVLVTSTVANPGNTIHVQSGTYIGTTGTAVNLGNAIIPMNNTNVSIEGYGANHYDNGTKPLITTATNSLYMVLVDGGNGETYSFDNLSFSTTASIKKPGIAVGNNGPPDLLMRNCILDGFTIAIDGNNSDSQFWAQINLYGVEIKNSTSHGIQNLSGHVYLFDGTWIHANTGDGITFNSSGGLFECHNSIVSANAQGISSSAGTLQFYLDTCAVANNSSNGIFVTSVTTSSSFISNSVIYGNGGWGVNITTALTQSGVNVGSRNSAFGSNISGDRKNWQVGLNDIYLTASPFVSSTNFLPNTTAGGGFLLKAGGYPGTFAGGSTPGVLDIGIQSGTGAPSCGISLCAFAQ